MPGPEVSQLTRDNVVENQISRQDKKETIIFLNGCWAQFADTQPSRAMFFSALVCLLAAYSVRGFIPVSPLADCPKIAAQSDVKIEQVAGTWRLAYLLVDDNEDFEEDNTCAVADIMQVNETQLELLLFVDGRKDEFTIDRYTKEFDVTVLEPGQWLLHTSFTGLEFIYVTVIGFTSKHLILTFCVDPFSQEDNSLSESEPVSEYDSVLKAIEGENLNEIFKSQSLGETFRFADDQLGSLGRQRRIRRPSRLLRGRRYVRNADTRDESRYQQMINFLKKSKSLGKIRKHLWTVVLVKDNNNSALRFVENASILMKYGFQIKDGQLVSFGSCSMSRK